jgi:hypothetical protein
MVNISAGVLSGSGADFLLFSSARACTGGAVGRRSGCITDNQGLVGIIGFDKSGG